MSFFLEQLPWKWGGGSKLVRTKMGEGVSMCKMPQKLVSDIPYDKRLWWIDNTLRGCWGCGGWVVGWGGGCNWILYSKSAKEQTNRLSRIIKYFSKLYAFNFWSFLIIHRVRLWQIEHFLTILHIIYFEYHFQTFSSQSNHSYFSGSFN